MNKRNNTILIVDTKAGNLFSLNAAIERLGYNTVILDKPDTENAFINPISNPSIKYAGIVIPGQGRFGTVLKNIKANGWQEYLEQARRENIPMLGICVGMQIFFEASDEDKGTVGFSWFKGKAEALDFPKKPMVGWASLESKLWPESVVYFVNSFAIKESEFTVASTTYGVEFVAGIKQGSFTGVQFHPEKSADDGAEIIRQAFTPCDNTMGDY
ncbi:MAG: imidazole glycerol phosphate synthase subunit HisH [Gammaproteobacteria bacterium]|nr:MAG: imidazole glycerol phosphate synthase subunit HisH [Gammaproteobacteria bacterium]